MFNEHNEFILLKNNDWFEKQKMAGTIHSGFMKSVIRAIENKEPNISLKTLSDEADSYIRALGGTPTFLGYKGFPSAICTSVNKQLVHGIATDYALQEGDVVSIDFGVTYEGAIADGAYTTVYGEPKSKHIIRLIKACQDSLNAGIKAIELGKRIGSIGNAIHKSMKDTGFGLVVNYGGHGLDWNIPHAAPFIANRADKNEGIHIQPGLTIAIEPMLTIGEPKTKVLDDDWTVVTPGIGAHFEHTIFVREDGEAHIITSHSMEVNYE